MQKDLRLRAVTPAAMEQMVGFHANIVAQVQQAVANNPIVVVGMAQNPHVKQVRQALLEAGFNFEYLEYGSYFAKWRERLAIKLWSGWPTYPQVFVKGVLLGGADLAKAAIADGSLKESLA